jgi:hypothetical protein
MKEFGNELTTLPEGSGNIPILKLIGNSFCFNEWVGCAGLVDVPEPCVEVSTEASTR